MFTYLLTLNTLNFCDVADGENRAVTTGRRFVTGRVCLTWFSSAEGTTLVLQSEPRRSTVH